MHFVRLGNHVLNLKTAKACRPKERLNTHERNFFLVNSMILALKNFFADENGATAIEYGLIAALIAIVIIGGVTAVGTSLSGVFTSVSGSLK